MLNSKRLSIAIMVLITSFMILPIYGVAAVFDVTNEEELRQALDMASSNHEGDVSGSVPNCIRI